MWAFAPDPTARPGNVIPALARLLRDLARRELQAEAAAERAGRAQDLGQEHGPCG